MSAVSIIIPVYNALAFARRCLHSVYSAATRTGFEVIVVNNGSAPEVEAWLASEQLHRPRLTVLHFEQPLGFARAVNAGAAAAEGDFLVVLNSDAEVTDYWLEGLLDAMASNARIGIASPVTNHSGPGPQLVDSPPSEGDPLPLIEEPRRLFFFCVMIRRTLWDSSHGLDEDYKVGTYEDDDFCLRTRAAGWSMVVVPHVFVANGKSRTFEENRIDRDEWMFRNETLFLEKASRVSTAFEELAHNGLAVRIEGSGFLDSVRDANGGLCASPTERTGAKPIPSTTVLVAVPKGAGGKLAASWNSLLHQTVTGFDVVIVSCEGDVLPALPGGIPVRHLTVQEDGPQGLAQHWNTALAASNADFTAYLPAGDVYFPFHLEVLHAALAAKQVDAVASSWSVAVSGEMAVKRASVAARPERHQAGAWVPLVCWLHARSCVPARGFLREFGDFLEWEFTLRLRAAVKTGFESAVTCEHQVWPARANAADAASVMQAHPAPEEWAADARRGFLSALQSGCWEDALILRPRDREQRERRVRRLMNRHAVTQGPEQALLAAIGRLESGLAAGHLSDGTDFIFLNILRWTDLTQRPHHFARLLGQRGFRVFWIDVQLSAAADFNGTVPVQEIAPHVFAVRLPGLDACVYHLPWTAPLLDLVSGAIGQVRTRYGIRQAVQFVNFPGWLPLVQRLRRDWGWPVVYDCLDDQHAFAKLFGQSIGPDEADLTRMCEVLVTSGHLLFETRQKQRADVVLIPNAAEFDVFHGASPRGLPQGLTGPVIGFFGAFCDWLDFDWIDEAARRFPDWAFVYIGAEGFSSAGIRARWQQATAHPNVHVYPQATLAELAGFLAGFDVCIMPFQDLPITRSMHPVKIYEYLAAGKNILAPALPEIVPFAGQNLLTTYRGREESYLLLATLAAEAPSADAVLRRTAFARQNQWRARVDQLLALLRIRGVIPGEVSGPGSAA